VKIESTVKISEEGKRKLRIISAYTGEKQYEVLDRLLSVDAKIVIKKGA
jgi:hypothetical protein